MMNGGGDESSLPNGGDFLLQLLRNPPGSKPSKSEPQPFQVFSGDPAVAAIGPSLHTFRRPEPAAVVSNGPDFGHHPQNQFSSPNVFPHQYFQQSPNVNPGGSSHSGRLSDASRQGNSQLCASRELEQNLVFGSFNRNVVEKGSGIVGNRNYLGWNEHGKSVMNKSPGVDGRLNWMPKNPVHVVENRGAGSVISRGYDHEKVARTINKQGFNGSGRANSQQPVRFSEYEYRRPFSGPKLDKYQSDPIDRSNNYRIDSPGPMTETRVEYAPTIENVAENGKVLRNANQDMTNGDGGRANVYDSISDLVISLIEREGVSESVAMFENKKHHRDKDYRSDKRGHWIMGQRMRQIKSQTICRSDIYRYNTHFTELFESLIPSEEEKSKQKQLLTTLEKLVVKEWPDARLHLYGSCANSFGFPKSDIDVCLAMKLENTDKAEVLLKLAEMLEAGNLQNVQALTRARVPIVKLMDPVTGIACDICINNILAVENTKLLRDYAQIDARLRQLAFIVKYWAKKREVNETYHGTLSSYAYVLMCIHFLQQRNPPILPCLQEMRSTYFTTVENVECSYFDRVDTLQEFGSRNRESIAELVWGFFHYWAYCHDYMNDVISVRHGTLISKREKDWTRRIGNDRHLICIEDPFEVSHDLGRVVDKFSIRVIREEFERAANIMQNDPRPGVTLFEVYNPS